MSIASQDRNGTQAPRRRGGGRPHWSYSQLSSYLRCPLRYYFEYVVKLPRPATPSSLVLGSAVHEALGEYHRHLKANLDVSPRQIEDTFLYAWKTATEERPVQFRDGESSGEVIDSGIGLVNLYLNQPPPKNIVGVEQEMTVPLFTSGGEILEKPLLAVLDLICRDVDGLTVIEFKTSGRRYSAIEVATALQATCYIHAVQEQSGGSVQLLYKVLLKTQKPQIQEIPASRSPADVTRLGDLVQSVDRAIAAEVFYPIESPMNCSTCPYRKPCKDWTEPVRSIPRKNLGSDKC